MTSLQALAVGLAPTVLGFAVNMVMAWAGKTNTGPGRALAAWFATHPKFLPTVEKTIEDALKAPPGDQ